MRAAWRRYWFAPGGEMGGQHDDGPVNYGELLGTALVPFDAIRESRKPVIASVNGLCMGGGLLITMLSDVAIASDRAGTITAASKFLRLLLQTALLGVGAYLAINDLIAPGVIIASSILLGRALGHQRSDVGEFIGIAQPADRLAVCCLPRNGF